MAKNDAKEVQNGTAECVFEPRGLNGLEGYHLGEKYRFQKMDSGIATWFRVYPDQSFPRYFEVCGPRTFHRYFKVVTNA